MKGPENDGDLGAAGEVAMEGEIEAEVFGEGQARGGIRSKGLGIMACIQNAFAIIIRLV
jgi:hypothetical protein